MITYTELCHRFNDTMGCVILRCIAGMLSLTMKPRIVKNELKNVLTSHETTCAPLSLTNSTKHYWVKKASRGFNSGYLRHLVEGSRAFTMSIMTPVQSAIAKIVGISPLWAIRATSTHQIEVHNH